MVETQAIAEDAANLVVTNIKPLVLAKISLWTLKIIQQLRNEAHRFGIGFHRDKRSKEFLKSELENISGVGEKTRQELYKIFKSLREISEAKLENLQQAVGKQKAKLIFDYFRKK